MLGRCGAARPNDVGNIAGVLLAATGFPAFLFDEVRHRYTLGCGGCHDLGGLLEPFDFADATDVERTPGTLAAVLVQQGIRRGGQAGLRLVLQEAAQALQHVSGQIEEADAGGAVLAARALFFVEDNLAA